MVGIHGNREDGSSAFRTIATIFGTYGDESGKSHVGCHGDQERGQDPMVDACLDGEEGVAYEEKRKG